MRESECACHSQNAGVIVTRLGTKPRLSRSENWDDFLQRLQLWQAACNFDPQTMVIRRNLERECKRNDIQPDVWRSFLQDLIHEITEILAYSNYQERDYATGSEWGDWFIAEAKLLTGTDSSWIDPLVVIDRVVQRRKSYFFMSGLEVVTPRTDFFYRYLPVRDFMRHHMHNHVFKEGNPGSVAELIKAGRITGSTMEGSTLGKPDYNPVWCTNNSLSEENSADEIRNKLGLKSIEGGHLVEVKYGRSMVLKSGCLRAPTFLDASASGAGNWIFSKNADDGGPGWGYTVHLCGENACKRGVPEAVHAPFKIDLGEGPELRLRTIGPLTSWPPGGGYQAILESDL